MNSPPPSCNRCSLTRGASAHRCDAPHELRSAYVGWAVLALLLYVIGIPTALAFALGVSPLRAAWAWAARGTAAARIGAGRAPRFLRPLLRVVAACAAGALLACMALHAALGAGLWCVWLCMRCFAGGMRAAVGAGSAEYATAATELRAWMSELLTGCTAPAAVSAAVRRWCGVPVGPFPDGVAVEVPPAPQVGAMAAALGHDYAPHAAWWELAVVLRKLALAVPLVVDLPNPHLRAMGALLVLVVATVLQVRAGRRRERRAKSGGVVLS